MREATSHCMRCGSEETTLETENYRRLGEFLGQAWRAVAATTASTDLESILSGVLMSHHKQHAEELTFDHKFRCLRRVHYNHFRYHSTTVAPVPCTSHVPRMGDLADDMTHRLPRSVVDGEIQFGAHG
jgi:hypothetical protein